MRYQVLGTLEVRDERGARELGGPQQRSVLAVLLAAEGSVITAGSLVDTIWGDAATDAALGTLQSYVSRLRKVVEPDRRPGDPFRVIVSEPLGYRLVVPDDDVDARLFERLAAEGGALLSAGRAAEAREALVRAESLWRGPAFLEHAHLDAVRGVAARLDERRGSVFEDRIDADLALGRSAEATAELVEAVRAEPLRERRRAQLALALYRSGRQADALRAIADARSTLVEELGIDPGAALVELEARILAQDPALRWSPAEASGSQPHVPDAERSRAHATVPAEGRRSAGAGSTDGGERSHRTAPDARADRTGERELFGREPAIARLEAELREARTGRRRYVLVGGEAGVGKTRLVEALAERAGAHGATVVWGHSHEGGGAPALWPWIEALGSIPDGDQAHLGEVLRSGGGATGATRPLEVARFELAEAVDDAIAGSGRTLLVVLEDLHWADAGTLALLRALIDRRPRGSVLFVGTYRDDEVVTAAPELAELLASAARSAAASRLRLDGLGPNDVAAFVAAFTGDRVDPAVASALHARTKGNPFFLGELVRLLVADGPAARPGSLDVGAAGLTHGVRDAVRRRLARQSDALRTLLTLAAVVGDDWSPELVAAAADLGLEEVLDLLDEALTSSLVEEVPGRVGRFRFAHALLRETILAEMTAVRRARAHLQVGRAMEVLWADDPVPHLTALAAQFANALAVGGAASAHRYAVLAAEAAAQRLAHDEAAVHWRAALQAHDLAPEGGREGRWRITLALGESLRLAGDWVGARATFDDALELAEALGPTQLAESATAYGGFWLWPQRGHGTVYARVIAGLERVLRELPPDDGRLRCRALGCLAIELFYVDRARCVVAAEDAVAMARRLDDLELLAFALNCHLMVLKSPDQMEDALAIADELAGLRDSGVAPELSMLARLTGNLARLQLGRVDGFAAEAEACLADAEVLHQGMLRALALQQRSLVAFAQGDLVAAEVLADEAYATYGPSAFWTTSALHLLQMVLIRREQGRLPELIGPAGAIDPAASPVLSRGLIDTTNAYVAAEVGRYEEASALLTPLPQVGFGSSYPVMKVMQAETVLRTGLPGAEQLLGELTRIAGQIVIGSTGPSCLGAVDTVIGRLQAELGDVDAAVGSLGAALELNRRLGPGPHAARTALALADVLRRRGAPGDGVRADAAEAEARRLATTLGLPALLDEFDRPAQG